MRLRYLLLAGAFLLAGCGTAAPDAPVGAVQGATAGIQIVAAPPAPAVGVPTLISIPKLGVTDEVVPVGLAADGSMQVPDVSESGWWRMGPMPGETGPAVIIGHRDWKGTPGALARIGDMKPGDLLVLKDTAGVERSFVTDAVVQISKSQYATRTVPLVFGKASSPELRVVTCSGKVTNHSYDSNTILSAHMIA